MVGGGEGGLGRGGGYLLVSSYQEFLFRYIRYLGTLVIFRLFLGTLRFLLHF